MPLYFLNLLLHQLDIITSVRMFKGVIFSLIIVIITLLPNIILSKLNTFPSIVFIINYFSPLPYIPLFVFIITYHFYFYIFPFNISYSIIFFALTTLTQRWVFFPFFVSFLLLHNQFLIFIFNFLQSAHQLPELIRLSLRLYYVWDKLPTSTCWVKVNRVRHVTKVWQFVVKVIYDLTQIYTCEIYVFKLYGNFRIFYL